MSKLLSSQLLRRPRTSSRGLLALTAILLIGGGALAGCGASVSTGSDYAGGDEAAAMIKDQYPEQTGLALDELSCEKTDPETGKTFICEGTNEAKVDLKIEGTVGKIDTDSDRFDFRWEVTHAVAAGTAYSKPALAELQDEGWDVDGLTCPDGIEIVKGTKVTCTATSSDGEDYKAFLKLTDGDGGFRIDLE